MRPSAHGRCTVHVTGQHALNDRRHLHRAVALAPRGYAAGVRDHHEPAPVRTARHLSRRGAGWPLGSRGRPKSPAPGGDVRLVRDAHLPLVTALVGRAFLETLKEFRRARRKAASSHHRPGGRGNWSAAITSHRRQHRAGRGRQEQAVTVSGRAPDPAAPAMPPADGMVWIPGATFAMGSDRHYPEEAPAHPVTVSGFWIDPRPVTNREFGRFVRKTGHVTVAERAPDPDDYPGARPEMLVPFSAVFVAPRHRASLADPHNWWTAVPGANWRQPQGPGSSTSKPDYPVVHLAGTTPTPTPAGGKEPRPSRVGVGRAGGLDHNEYTWGEELVNQGKPPKANTFRRPFSRARRGPRRRLQGHRPG